MLTTLIDAFPTGQMQFEMVPAWVWKTSKWDRHYGSTTLDSTAVSTTHEPWPTGSRAWNTWTRRR